MKKLLAAAFLFAGCGASPGFNGGFSGTLTLTVACPGQPDDVRPPFGAELGLTQEGDAVAIVGTSDTGVCPSYTAKTFLDANQATFQAEDCGVYSMFHVVGGTLTLAGNSIAIDMVTTGGDCTGTYEGELSRRP